MGELKAAIKNLEDSSKACPGVISKLEELKKGYEKEHGLPYEHPTMEKIETFIKWMKDNGAHFDKIRMRYYGLDYRGVHTFKKIEASELFLHVPKKLIITSQKGKETPLGAKILKSGVELSWDYLIYITVFLLTQFHDPNSFWKPYMDVYPKDVSTFPMFFTEEEKQMLKGSPICEHIVDEVQEIKEEYNLIVKAVPEFKQFSLDEYMKNKTLVISRIFYVKIHGVTERIMVPLADMFNHHYDRLGETFWRYDDKDDAFVVHAEKPIPAGDPICENYGQKPNYRFLFYYGFLIENNPKNCVYVKLHFNKDDPALIQKGNMIGAYPDSEIKTFKYFEGYRENQLNNDKFLSYLRLIEYKGDLNLLAPYLNPVVGNAKSCSFYKRKFRCPPVSLDNEKNMLTKLKLIAEKCLKKYPDPYEKDMELLKNDKSLSFNQRNCLILRSDEKKIYKDMIAMAELGLKLLDMKNSMMAQECFNEIKEELPYATYFKKSLLPFLHRVK